MERTIEILREHFSTAASARKYGERDALRLSKRGMNGKLAGVFAEETESLMEDDNGKPYLLKGKAYRAIVSYEDRF